MGVIDINNLLWIVMKMSFYSRKILIKVLQRSIKLLREKSKIIQLQSVLTSVLWTSRSIHMTIEKGHDWVIELKKLNAEKIGIKSRENPE